MRAVRREVRAFNLFFLGEHGGVYIFSNSTRGKKLLKLELGDMEMPWVRRKIGGEKETLLEGMGLVRKGGRMSWVQGLLR